MLRALDKDDPSVLMALTISYIIKYRRSKEGEHMDIYDAKKGAHAKMNNLEIRATVTCRNVTLHLFKTTSPCMNYDVRAT